MFSPSNTLKSLNVAVAVFVDSNLQEIIPVVKPDVVIFRVSGSHIYSSLSVYLIKNFCLTLGRSWRAWF